LATGQYRGRHGADDALIVALSAGATVAAAARHAQVSEPTVRRRLAEPGFRAKVDAARADLVSQAVGRLASVGVLAVDKLHELLGAKSQQTQLGAARAVLEFLFRGVEIDVLARQVAELKELVEGGGDGTTGAADGRGGDGQGAGEGEGPGGPPAGDGEG
jgi:hypothetical protein